MCSSDLGQIRKQVYPGAANVVLVDVAAKRRVVFVPFQDIAEIADPRRRQGFHRPGGNGVDADVFAAKVFG